jgi:hypothetical protein
MEPRKAMANSETGRTQTMESGIKGAEKWDGLVLSKELVE